MNFTLLTFFFFAFTATLFLAQAHTTSNTATNDSENFSFKFFDFSILPFPLSALGIYTIRHFLKKPSVPSPQTPNTPLIQSKSSSCLYVSPQQTTSKPSQTTDSDVLIIGAGVAGASLALTLARHNSKLKIILIERDLSEPKRIVGELLQPSGYELLKSLKIEDSVEGIDSVKIRGYGVLFEKMLIDLPYPSKQAYLKTQSEEQFEGRSFHNGRFVQKLRNLCKNEKNIQIVEATVTDLIRENNEIKGAIVRRRIENGANESSEIETFHLTSALTVVCDGCFSGLRISLSHKNMKNDSKSQIKTHGRFLGLILRNSPLPIQNSGHCLLTNPTPTLLYPISSEDTRVLIDFPNEMPTDIALKSYLLKEILPQMPLCTHESFRNAVEKGEFRAMPNRSLPPIQCNLKNVLLIGDSFNMRHPLTGGGMTVAFTDIHYLVNLILNVKDWSDFKKINHLVSNFRKDRPSSKTINILADALYQVFCQKNFELRESCFEYLSVLNRSKGPVALLSGVSRSQLLLFRHFFAVALFGMKQRLFKLPSPNDIQISIKMIRSAVRIITPLIVQENDNIWVRAIAWAVRTGFWV